jgi:hypothetical protein
MIPWWGDLLIAVVAFVMFVFLVCVGLMVAGGRQALKEHRRNEAQLRERWEKRRHDGPMILNDPRYDPPEWSERERPPF